MLDFDKLLEEAAPSETTVRLCLSGPLVRRYEEVKERVDARTAQAATDADTRLGGRRRTDPEQDELDRLITEIQDHTATFTLRAMTRDQFIEFVAEKRFEVRRDRAGEPHPADARMGLNSQTFVPELVRASVADPDLSDDTRWARLVEVLTAVQMERLFGAAWDLNKEDREVPFSPSGSPSPQS